MKYLTEEERREAKRKRALEYYYRAKDTPEFKEKAKLYESSPERKRQKREYQKKRRKKPAIREREREYRKERRELLNAYHREYYAEHADWILLQTKRRRLKKYQAEKAQGVIE